MAASIALDSARFNEIKPAHGRKLVGTARQSVNGHTVPSTLLPCLRREIVGSLRAGRSVPQAAKEYDCSQFVAIELWLRDLERRVAGMARPMAIAAFFLTIGVSYDAWQATVGDGAEIARTFRSRRGSRRRGLEDELAEAMEHAHANIATEAPGLALERAA